MCVHSNGRVVYVNPAGVRGFGAQSEEQLVGRPITDFVHPDSVGDMLTRILALSEEGDSSPASEAVLLRLDGSPLEVEVVSVLTTWDGDPAYQVIFRDLTAQKAAEAALRYQAALVNHVSDAIIATTADGIVTSWNAAAAAIYRRPVERALGLPLTEAVDADVDLPGIVAGGGVVHATHRSAGGTAVNVRLSVTAMDDGYVVLCSDYTAQRRAEIHFESVVRSLHDGVVVLDRRGKPQSINPAARRILRLDTDGLVEDYANGTLAFPIFDRRGVKIDDNEMSSVKLMFANAPLENVVLGVERADGSRAWLSINCCLLDPADAENSALLVSFADITAEHNAKTHLAYQAHHDPLTGLPNRAQIEARLTDATTRGSQRLAAVLFVDLDNLKAMNDDLGHHAGDGALRETARRLRNSVRDGDFVGRLSGDEFVILLYGILDRPALEALTARMHGEFADPIHVGGRLRRVSISIGVTELSAEDERTVENILRDADAAMYQAKILRTGTSFRVTRSR
ncbi:diguanylate cyclase [Mycolicibacterium rufum]|uniref:Diguanylate cyclase n=1 Tax=Mycolicibacterium rufum TaxID=318424 RepID=A0ABY3UM20_9MYCO|nr:diguanylate cyclase [Mycolicibacterium rufum]ULP38190.1 diguanylate cyclase [Mycolicibacterium rufum]